MSRKISRLNKKKMSALIRGANRHNLSLGAYLMLVRSISEHKASKRLERRHGTYIDWHSSESFLSRLLVPLRLNHNKKAIAYLIMAESEIPKQYEHLRELIEDK